MSGLKQCGTKRGADSKSWDLGKAAGRKRQQGAESQESSQGRERALSPPPQDSLCGTKRLL